MLMLRWAGSPLLLQTLMLMLVQRSRWIGGAVVVHRPVLRGSTTGQSSHSLPLLGFLVGVIASFTIMMLLTNSGNVLPVLSAMHSCSLEERPIMMWSFFLLSVSTWSGAYCARWLNCLE
jgi:hypothetical protein